MFWQRLNLNASRFDCDAFGQIALNVLEKSVCGRFGQAMEMHESIVRSDFVLNAMLLVNVHGFQKNETIVMWPPQCPTEKRRREK